MTEHKLDNDSLKVETPHALITIMSFDAFGTQLVMWSKDDESHPIGMLYAKKEKIDEGT